MNSTTADYQAASIPLSLLLHGVGAEQWDNPSPCEQWTVADVVSHLIHTQRDFLIRNDIGLSDPPPGVDPATTWRLHSASVLDAVADDAVASAGFDGGFGPSTIGETLVQFYVWDMIAHRWDIARGTGLEAELTSTEIDRLERGISGFGDALYMDGICKPGVPAPADADRMTAVLARLGRHA
ncbi:maleylpyruvate isomerase family mycothiol-dependent enzyme [Paeniglutamicibacter antarcticus]|uniref:TIGR03086 family metal-binding protein n=1 Tax=Paeniglutamicibacter antarcticus TaxID=494023 RepID=A0ABP9TRM0_9MICC